ncbi:AMIN domain-containing protein [Brasilonema octagenarum UFV-E1]|uniref:AMIN domain-containing protein n=2 Tax=Brasilonema TaxID=383614 RepID=A0A856MIP8_9CYAN|nr:MULTISPECIES: AMIN domain-containing protein [Brasilonema]NMF63682.1 AMIN domain-containing protein [Brasilonema octagenarum UFV-OR1]QDL09027.1 AMIN domain-containing protein [Brasilonema sennae CENA114]QDL15384.1 AMIN domain-containing protein [Brasilonema octagenarum UFV-E1]
MNKQLKNKQFFLFCKYLFRVSLFALCTGVLYSKPPSVYSFDVGNSNSVAPLARLEDWRFYPEGSQLEISLSAAAQPRYFYLAQPSRIVIDLPGTKLGRIPTKQNFYGAIRSIRVSQLNADVTRIVMDLAPGIFMNPNQMQLQPVSRENPTRWVLRPSLTSNGTSLPGNFSSTTISPPLPSKTPGIYTPPQPPSNLAPSGYNNSPQPFSNSPLGVYNSPQPPSNLPPATYNDLPQVPGNPPSTTYNQQQVPDFRVPPPLTTQPTTNNFPQAPSVQVPPLAPNNSSQLPGSAFSPPSFPRQGSSYPNNNAPSLGTSNFPVPNLPTGSRSYPNSKVIEFGEPFPNSSR